MKTIKTILLTLILGIIILGNSSCTKCDKGIIIVENTTNEIYTISLMSLATSKNVYLINPKSTIEINNLLPNTYSYWFTTNNTRSVSKILIISDCEIRNLIIK